VKHFREFDKIGILAQANFIAALLKIERLCGIHYKEPKHDIARRFLNEICEFEAYKESEDYSIEDLF